MKRVKQRTDSGVICELEIYNVSDAMEDVRKAKPPRPRFASEEEREAHRRGIARRRNIRKVNNNFTPASYYSTLTLDDPHEVHTFKEARRLARNFIRALKRHAPGCKIMLYMGRGENTDRIHFHMLSDGIPEDVICALWKMGEVRRIVHLREHNSYNGVDHGQDYTGLANYLFNHWTPEQGGRCCMETTSTLVKPKKEEPKEIKREYSPDKPPRAPKGYFLVETKATKYGYLYFKYVKKPPKRERKRACSAAP